MLEDPSLAYRIKAVNNQIKRLFEKTAIAQNDANLTGMQYAILGFLAMRARDVPIFQRDIEAEFNIRRSTASSMLVLLEKCGYIKRISVPEDARLKKIIQTDKAKELDKIVREHIKKFDERLRQNITPEEMRTFITVLDKIVENTKD